MKRFISAWLAIVLGVLFTASCSRAQFPAAPGTGPGLPETIEAIDSARITTRILYITAHPDDESAAVLTYLARGLHADVALLSLTHGEGGQNALGPEQAPQLGLIRTQELLAATRGYGVKLYFTRAKDFGYSKTPEETEKVWGDQVLQDMVRVIREFRPNIVINHWSGVHSGHGHHQASGIWTPKAVALAADKSYRVYRGCVDCPVDYTWGSSSNPVVILALDRSDNPSGYTLPLDDVSPLYGKTWREIGIDAFTNHRTQGIAGFLNSPFIRRPIGLKREDGASFNPEMLARPLDQLAAFPGAYGCESPSGLSDKLKNSQEEISVARSEALALHWPQAAASLAQAAITLKSLYADHEKPPTCDASNPLLFVSELMGVQSRLDRAIQLASGIDIRADADQSNLAAGNRVNVTTTARYRPLVACQLSAPQLRLPSGMQELSHKKESDNSETFSVEIKQEYQKQWGWTTGLAEGLPLITVRQQATVAGYVCELEQPVVHIEATSTSVVRVPLRIVPAYTLSVEPDQNIQVLNITHRPFDVLLRVHSYSTKAAKVSVGLDVPDDITSSAPVNLAFEGAGDQYAKLTVTPPTNLAPGNFTVTAYAKRGDEKFTTSLEPLPSMPTLLWSEPAQTVVHAFDINVPGNLHVGYISAEGEPIPDALRRLGISVDLLGANALTFGDLAKFDAIVVGVRAYELRPELASANKRLLDYVLQGGTLVVQYNRDNVWDRLQPAPYSAKISSPTPRITDENAHVTFLKPGDPLLNQPNKITQADFENWIQERGLYFWSDFDSSYTPLLSMNDPGESALNGALVYTHFGKGVYIYTGLAFFRELPEGIPGAYRLFVNLLSATKTK